MKVRPEPVSAFAIYSEKLKQKKKKCKTQLSNGVNKVKKSQVSNGVNKNKKSEVSTLLSKPKKNSEKESWQMKEIGFILKTLAERSADTSSPRAATLLDSINEANHKLSHDDSTFLENTLQNVILVESLKDKAKSLKRKKTSKTTKLANDRTSANGSKTRKSTFPMANTEKESKARQVQTLNLKKLKITTEKPDMSAVKSSEKAEYLNKKQAKLTTGTNQQNIGVIPRVQIKSNKKIKGKYQTIFENSDSTAKKLFEWVIKPMKEEDFMRDFWEKKPLLIQRERNRKYFSELLSSETIDTMLRENNVCFTKHLDVTSYNGGVRETHNLSGRAQANLVWDFYSNGCSVRLLNPQVFLPKIHALNATLQEYFGCFVGANVYLTPPNSQGFAPHFDDIEAFVLQIEGKKRWKLYTPRNEAEVLPRFSSPNFTQEEAGESFLDVTLEPGDLLYFPRGFIHQASTVDGKHSLHITLSAYQKTAWVDLLEKALPIALKKAAESDVEFRRGLPRNYLSLEHRGSAREKQSFVSTAQFLMKRLGYFLELSLGAGVDQMGAQFMHDALPPVFTPGENQTSSLGGGLKLKDGKLYGRVDFQMDTCVKLIRHNICRLVEEEEEVRLYHCLDNSLEYHREDPQFLVLPPEGIPVITHLLASYPTYVCLQEIPHEDTEALITLISDLWDAGLLSAKDLPTVEED